MNEEIEIIISPTPEVIQYLFDSGDITLCEFIKYQKDNNYLPAISEDHE